ncbi:MAG: TetR/AcrR family transcriptional regulator [Parvibaculum sp.]
MEDDRSDAPGGKSARTQEKIVIALFELVKEGNLRPLGEEIAAKAEVSVRTLFRHFADMESLFAIAQAIMAERMTGDLGLPSVSGPFVERCHTYAMAQGKLYDESRNYLLFYASRAKTVNEINKLEKTSSQHLRLRLWSALPECAAAHPPIREAIVQLFSFHAWQQLRHEQGLSSEDAVNTICKCTHELLKASMIKIDIS